MLAKIFSCGTLGLNPFLVEVEVDVSNGLPAFEIVGLPDAAVKESKERVRAAIKNSGFELPPRKYTINLAPADIKKEGPSFDLPIALGILSATEQINVHKISDFVCVGELSLDGSLRKAPGILPIAYSLVGSDKILIVPEENASEAAITDSIVYGFKHLSELAHFFNNKEKYSCATKLSIKQLLEEENASNIDISDVKGHQAGKRALEVAAAGGHNILLIGSPGSGKTMLARRLPTILPPLTEAEAIELSKIYSIAGLLPSDKPVVTVRPFRSPHHSASSASLIGGGRVPRPGEVSLSTHGVLFLDELPEYSRNVLEALRQPLEDQVVTVSRVSATISYPARFILAAGQNPCYCGYYGDSVRQCTCTPYQVQKYRNKISGPLLDRIDIQIEIPRVEYNELHKIEDPNNEKSSEIRARVINARNIQLERFNGTNIYSNSQMSPKEVRKFCKIQGRAKDLLQQAFDSLGLSARAHDRILKLARTIADLAGSENINEIHIAEAIQYRILDRKIW